MTKITFETAAIADAIKKANKVAPNRGEAFDKASGIVIEVDPTATPPVTIRATNLDIFHTEWVDAISVEGAQAIWRVPASLIASVMATLPIGTGSQVTLEEVASGLSNKLELVCGRTKAKFNLMMHMDYPRWDIFDPDDLTAVTDLGGRVAMVEWAASNEMGSKYNGVYFDGEKIICTDRYRLTTSPMKIASMPEPVMVPPRLLGSILKQTGEVMIGFTPNQVLIMPNDQTQLRVVRLANEFPDVSRIMNRERPMFIEVSKSALLQIIGRAVTFAAQDRMPTLRMFFGKEEIAVMIANEDIGLLGDVLEVPGQAKHDRCEIRFTPKNLTEALDMAPNDKVRIGYDPDLPSSIMYIDGGSGYESWVVTRKESA